jgi:hypothetical protein
MVSPSYDQRLQTKYLFVDTEAFRRAQFDWNGKALAKLAQFAAEGHLNLLITDVTKREVCRHLQERLVEATSAAKRHEIVFAQLGSSGVTAALNDPGAFKKLEEAFKAFLRATNAIDVPTAATIDEVLSDYFARRPPFSDKKKAEFPDAVVIASLRAWCANQNAKAYVVSGDPDLKACCSVSGPLLYASSIEDVISQATVSKELHEALAGTLFDSDLLREWLSEKLLDLTVVRGDSRLRRFSGAVRDVDGIDIDAVNVLEREGMHFECEIEFGAWLVLRLDFEQQEFEDYEPLRVQTPEKSVHRRFRAEVVVRFDPAKLDETELESVYLDAQDVELEVEDFR